MPADRPDELLSTEPGDPGDENEPLDTLERLLARVAHAPPARPPLVEGDRLGRYLLVRKLGAGGMGVVFAAYDPQLDRTVAIKVLRPDVGGMAMSSRARDRTLREARALARLVHPNIVAVHDAGFHNDELYIVMELVAGQSLRHWLMKPRTTKEVLAVFRQAADGLIAAHTAGMVHRDFKPDNVLVGDDHRVRVADFGLVQIASAPASPDEEPAAGATGDAKPTGALTVTGSFMGTPGYISPEQRAGGAVDARADQYSFGVSLWQALYGCLPTDQTTLPQRGKIAEPPLLGNPTGKRVPGWLRQVALRAMAPIPAERYPDLAAVAAAIDRGLARPRRLAAIGAGVGIAAVVAGSLAYSAVDRPREDPCLAGAAVVREVWNPARARQLAAAMPTTAAGEQTGRSLAARLDDYAGRWADGHRATCRATEVDHVQSRQALDVRMACLRRARGAVDVLVTGVIAGEVPAAAALTAVDHLPSLDQCGDDAAVAMMTSWPDEPELAARIETAGTAISRTQLDLHGVVDAAALERGAAAVRQARDTQWPPLIAEAELSNGNLQFVAKNTAAALASYREAVRAALAGGHDRVALRALAETATALAELGRHDDARDVLELGRAFAVRLQRDPTVTDEIETAAWEVARRADRFDDALRAADAALKASRASGDDAAIMASLVNLAVAQFDAGQVTQAVTTGQEGIALRERLRGPEHPDLIIPLRNQASFLMTLGRTDEALALADRTLAITERWYGTKTRFTAEALQTASGVYVNAGRFQQGIVLAERALELRDQLGDADSTDYAELTANLAMAYAASGELDKARAGGQRALATLERRHGPRSPNLGKTLVLLGWVERERGDLAASETYLARALRDAEAVLGGDTSDVVNTRNELAHTQRARRRFAEAIALYERSLRAATARDVNPAWIGEAELGLAEALWEGRRDRGRALALAASARDRYASLGEAYEPQREAAAAWIAAHPAR